MGALTVAAIMFLWDVTASRMLFTPGALGSALFTGELLSPGASIHPGVVLAYTIVHGGLFVAGGVLTTSVLQAFTFKQRPSLLLGGVLAGGLFLTMEAMFAAFHGLFLVPGLVDTLGTGAVGAANAAAAVVMASFLMGRRWADDQ
jgi:hypothetical protein